MPVVLNSVHDVSRISNFLIATKPQKYLPLLYSRKLSVVVLKANVKGRSKETTTTTQCAKNDKISQPAAI